MQGGGKKARKEELKKKTQAAQELQMKYTTRKTRISTFILHKKNFPKLQALVTKTFRLYEGPLPYYKMKEANKSYL